MTNHSVSIDIESKGSFFLEEICKFLKILKQSFRVHFLLILLIGCYFLIYISARKSIEMDGRTITLQSAKPLLVFTLHYLNFIICGRTFYIIFFIRPKRLLKFIFTDFMKNSLLSIRLAMALPIFLIIPLFIALFCVFKPMIPFWVPYSWDAFFTHLDSILHGGVQPWQLLHPLLGYPFITVTINFFYILWFFIMYGVLLWQVFSLRDIRLRQQFLFTFLASWIILGTGAAILFSSAGPCYYGRITGLSDPFMPLMSYLQAANEIVPISALHTQEMLWSGFLNSKICLGSGISAMPSLHVSMAFLFTLVGWRTRRVLGIVFTAYAFIILIGSVHLGWHYAVDGYVAIIGTWIIWKAVGFLLNRYPFLWEGHFNP